MPSKSKSRNKAIIRNRNKAVGFDDENQRGVCAICSLEMLSEFADYPFAVCRTCDDRAVNAAGTRPWTAQDSTCVHEENGVMVIDDGGDGGENPIFIDGVKCWRRYKSGGWVTMKDPFDCRTIKVFYERLSLEGLPNPAEY